MYFYDLKALDLQHFPEPYPPQGELFHEGEAGWKKTEAHRDQHTVAYPDLPGAAAFVVETAAAKGERQRRIDGHNGRTISKNKAEYLPVFMQCGAFKARAIVYCRARGVLFQGGKVYSGEHQ